MPVSIVIACLRVASALVVQTTLHLAANSHGLEIVNAHPTMPCIYVASYCVCIVALNLAEKV